MRLVRKAFSEEEWTVLNRYPEFIERAGKAGSVDEADVVIRAGADILDKLAEDGRASDRARLDGPPTQGSSE